MDKLTKYSHFLAIKHPYPAATITHIFLDNIVKLHGIPRSIVSGKYKVFTSAFWTELFKLLQTDLKMNSAYHPQTDGQTKCVNKCLEMFLRCSVQASPKKWSKWLPLAGLWYNTSFHTSLQCSPFKALYGMDPFPAFTPTLKFIEHQEVSKVLKERQIFTEMLKEQLARAQNRMKMYDDNNMVEKHFQAGDQVLLKLQPYSQSSVVNSPFPKLAFKYFGPYQIVDKMGDAAYKLQLSVGSLIHPVFYVSQLKEFTPNYSPVYSQLQDIPVLDSATLLLESILEHRLARKGNMEVTQILVKWTGLPASFATWEDYNVMKIRFPEASIWGQLVSSEGSSVTDPSVAVPR
jgi:hypothetical protein